METQEQTQPSTQQVLDPRRVGRNNSGLDDNDIADVLAILHPASPYAIRVVEDMTRRRPEHVLLRNAYDSFDSLPDIEEQETIIINQPPQRLSPTVGNDLALRMSSRLREQSSGFVFGRNLNTADIIFSQDSGKRISNQHFRIYLNADAILMLEDMSTNGTVVDDVLLRHKERKFNAVRMLASGSIICINSVNEKEMIKFIVRIPSRASHMDRFEMNLQAFFTRCVQDKAKLNTTLQRLGKRQLGGQSMKWDGGEQYNIIGQVGKGAFATVYQLATKLDGKLLAAKELEKRRFMKNGQLDKKIDNEMKIMQDLKHPNIVEFVEYHDKGDFLYIVMEYVRCGDLQGYLNQHGVMKESDARLMAQQVLNALGYLHRMKITHRDIKPDNILIADTNPLKVKLSDFGLSKVVKADETFLKTFCGTLLYCAPEVFPDFDDRLRKGTKRGRSSKQQYHSYSSSVDVWSFAGVIWYALCGRPPFEGITDATGQAMYNNIMSTDLDSTPLREQGVSEVCIDLLCKMLQKDPARRPTDYQCLKHPWLRDDAVLPDDPTLQSIAEEPEDDAEAGAEEELSQLSLNEDFVPDSDGEADDVLQDDEFEMLVGARQSKKIRTDPLIPRNQPRYHDHDSSADVSFQSKPRFESGIQTGESFNAVLPQPGRPRLFGEISQSALQSSGILSLHANDALSNEDSGDAQPSQLRRPATETRQRTPPIRPQMDGTYSSPSLLGAESMVRDLNMASPQHSHGSQGSLGQSENEPPTPKTPDVPQHNSLEKHSQQSEATPKAKPPAFNRQISLPKTASFYYDPYDTKTHTLEHASKVSGFDFVGAAEAAKLGESEFADTMRQSAQDSGEPSVVKEASKDSVSHIDSWDKGTFDDGPHRRGAIQLATPEITQDDSGAHPPGTTITRANEQTDSKESSFEPVLALPTELDIKPPPRRLGRLVATSDSFAPGLTLAIDQSKTSWGRLPSNTIVYENGTDTRVPKTALIVFWWSSAGEDVETVSQLSSQGKDWTSMPGIHCGIFTCATSGISVNGKHLRQMDDKGRALFGHLHHGDIIQVYQAAKGAECLKFKAEIYLGSGKEPRPPGEVFNIFVGSKLPQA